MNEDIKKKKKCKKADGCDARRQFVNILQFAYHKHGGSVPPNNTYSDTWINAELWGREGAT